MKPVLIVQNDAHEGAGSLATLLAQRGIDQHVVQGFGAKYSELASDRFSALVVLGGAQSAYETDKYTFLKKEMALCRDFVDAQKPLLGFCLGAQILAAALGGEVVPGKQKEIGWYDLTLRSEAKEDPLMRNHPSKLLAYHFHGDVIQNVPQAITLASSDMTPLQAFRYGPNAYGFQYHAEVDRSLLADMCRNNHDYLAANGIDAESLISDSQSHLPDFERHCTAMLKGWIELLRAEPDGARPSILN